MFGGSYSCNSSGALGSSHPKKSMPVALEWMLKNCSVLAPGGIATSRPSTRSDSTPGLRYFRAANASAKPSTACPATIFVTLSAQHGVRSRSW